MNHVAPRAAEATHPHVEPTLGNLATLFVKGLVSDRRERRRISRTPDGRSAWKALDPRIHAPVFVVGAPRSGTTFLGASLGAVPGVSYHFEPRLTKSLIRLVYSGQWSDRRAQRVFRTSYSSLLLVAGDGGRRFVDKTPENSFIIPFLADTFPDSVFVHIIRDGRDVAVSHAEKPWLSAAAADSGQRGRGGAKWGPAPRFWVEAERGAEFSSVTDLDRTAWAWRRFTQSAIDNLDRLERSRWITIRYEDLVADPVSAAGRLSTLMTLQRSAQASLAEALALAKPTSVGRWRSRLDDQEQAAVEAQCGPLLHRLGYA